MGFFLQKPRNIAYGGARGDHKLPSLLVLLLFLFKTLEVPTQTEMEAPADLRGMLISQKSRRVSVRRFVQSLEWMSMR